MERPEKFWKGKTGLMEEKRIEEIRSEAKKFLKKSIPHTTGSTSKEPKTLAKNFWKTKMQTEKS